MPDPLFSVVIPVCGFNTGVEAGLRALDAQSNPEDFECILVDDGYGLEIASHPDSPWPSIDLSILRNHARMGRSISLNRGWRAARSRYVVFLDADMIPGPGWLDAYRRVMQDKSYDLVSGVVNSGPRGSERVDSTHWLPSPLSKYWFSGSNVLVARELLAASGGFPSFLRKGGEFHLGLRLAELKPRVGIAEDAIVRKMDGSTLEGHWTEFEHRAFLWRNPCRSAVLADLCERSVISRQSAAGDDFSVAQAECTASELDPSLSAWHRLVAALPAELVPGVFDCSEGELARYFSELSGAEQSVVSGYLKEAVALGLVVKQFQGQTYFDLYHTYNQLRAKTHFFEDELKNSSIARTRPTPLQRGLAGARPVVLHVKGKYTMKLDSHSGLNWNWDEVNLNLGLPIVHALQTNIRITSLSPAELVNFLDQDSGLIANVPGALCRDNGGCIGYEFECDVEEGSVTRRGVEAKELSPQELNPQSPYLRFAFLRSYLEMTASLLDHILEGARGEPEEDVRRIYRWIVENLSVAPMRLPDYAILDCGMGSCVHLTRLFINLVRLRGVPAREQCGALMTRPMSSSEVVTVSMGHSPFTHTWAEVCLDGLGWFPVDFVVIGYGRWLANSFNGSAPFHAELIAGSERLLEYYFGNIDPYRVYASRHANRIPPLVATGSSRTRLESEQKLHIYHRLAFAIS